MFNKPAEDLRCRLAVLNSLTLATNARGGVGRIYGGVPDIQCTVSSNIRKAGPFVYLEIV